MTNSNTINFQKFLDTYKPENNNFVEDAPFDGYMFETYGKEVEYVKKMQDKYKCIWTVVDEDGEMFIVYGMRFINRIGYFVTKQIPLNPEIIVVLE